MAANGIQGVELFDAGRFDLVITDIAMPGMDGNKVARHIRKTGSDTPKIIAITGTPETVDESLFDKVIYKPFGINTLSRLLTDMVDIFRFEPFYINTHGTMQLPSVHGDCADTKADCRNTAKHR